MDETNTDTQKFDMPLHLELAMRKAELDSMEMTWDQLQLALLNLFHKRLIETQAIKDMLSAENIELELISSFSFSHAYYAGAPFFPSWIVLDHLLFYLLLHDLRDPLSLSHVLLHEASCFLLVI
jgi:hypothetical protein